MPTELLNVLDQENRASNGAVEKYIYLRFEERQSIVAGIIALIEQATPATFDVTQLFELFQKTQGIRRSIDKVYEIVVYSLLETVVVALKAEVSVSVPANSKGLIVEFSELAKILLGLEPDRLVNSTPAHVHRVGVTNASDRGLDMWANFGPAIQVKHLTLDPKLAQQIVDQVESDNIIIVCRDADQRAVEAVLKQIRWGKRVRGILNESQLVEWYERCLRGTYTSLLATDLLKRLDEEFKQEFPQAVKLAGFIKERKYMSIASPAPWDL